MCTGLLAGALNGFLIAKVRITPILATIGTGQLYVGVCLVLSGGPAIVGFPDGWDAIGNTKLLGVALPLVLFVAIAGLVALALTRTPLGINLQLIGANPKAAVFAGIRTSRAILVSYVASGGAGEPCRHPAVGARQRGQSRLRHVVPAGGGADLGAGRHQPGRRQGLGARRRRLRWCR